MRKKPLTIFSKLMTNNKRQIQSLKILKARGELSEARQKSRKKLLIFCIGCIVVSSLAKRN